MTQTSLVLAAVALVAPAAFAALDALPDARARNSVEVRTAAAERTVVFAVENMTCAACPITVRKAIEKVKGVKSVSVDLDAKTATVVFDPAVATLERIGAASTNAGYPASPAS